MPTPTNGFRLPAGPHDLGEFINMDAVEPDPPFNFDEWQAAGGRLHTPSELGQIARETGLAEMARAAAEIAAEKQANAQQIIPPRASLLTDYIKRIHDLPSGATLVDVRPVIEAAWKAGFQRPEEISTLRAIIISRQLSIVGVTAKAVDGMFSSISANTKNEQREVGGDWRLNLQRTERDKVPIANAFNAGIALNGVFGGCIRHDSFTDKVYVREKPDGVEKVLDDHLHFRLLTSIQANGFPQARKSDTADAVHAIARQNSKDALVEKLNSLHWANSTERVDTWLQRYCHVEDTPYYRMLGRFTLLQAVARAFEPGVKADLISILIGRQGTHKSSLWRSLSYGWYREFTDDFAHKDGLQQMRGCWFVELAELSAMNRKEVAAVKAFLTKQEDNYRKAYGREDKEYARQFSLCGSANPEPFLKDYTGSRRFACAEVSKPIDIVGLRDDVDQLWAEAVAMYRHGLLWYPRTEKDQWFFDAQEAANEKWQEPDPWDEIIERYVWHDMVPDGQGGHRWSERRAAKREYVRSAGEVLQHVFRIPIGQFKQQDQNRVGKILGKMGYERETIRAGGERFTGYRLRR